MHTVPVISPGILAQVVRKWVWLTPHLFCLIIGMCFVYHKSRMSRKRKHVKGQRTLSGTLTDSSESSSSGFTTAVKCRGTLSTWRDFGEAKWKTQFPWLELDLTVCIATIAERVRPRELLEVAVKLLFPNLTLAYVLMFCIAIKTSLLSI